MPTLSPETVVERGALWTIAVNRNQDLLGKTMLVLNRPCQQVVELEPQEWSALHGELQRLLPAITAVFAPDHFNFAFLMNQDAQVHLHVVPRYVAPREWNDRRFEDAHWGSAFGHEQHVLPLDELEHLAREIRDRLQPGQVRLRPIEEGDLEVLARFDREPELSQPFEWRGFRDARARRRRWEKDGYLSDDDSMLVVARPDGTFAGFVVWRPVRTSGPRVCLNIGIGLLPEHQGKGLGTAAQRLLADYLFATTLANRIEATTEVDNVAEQKALERAGFRREGLLRGGGFGRGRLRDGLMYARLRDDPVPEIDES